MAQARELPEFRSYMPDNWLDEDAAGRKPKRAFVLGVIGTLYTDWLRDAYLDICHQRA